MNAVIIDEPAVARNRLRVFALCLESATMERGRWPTRQFARHETGRCEVLLQVWKFDPVTADSTIQNLIAPDAAEADMLVIAIRSLHQRRPALVEWLNSLTPWKHARRRGGLLVGLFGNGDHPAEERARMVSELGGFARRTGMKFLWKWMPEGTMQDARWLEIAIEELIHANGLIPSGSMPASTI